MATEGDVELELETETSCPERPPEKPRKHDSGAADLERVTDYAEEKEIQSSNLETVRLLERPCLWLEPRVRAWVRVPDAEAGGPRP